MKMQANPAGFRAAVRTALAVSAISLLSANAYATGGSTPTTYGGGGRVTAIGLVGKTPATSTNPVTAPSYSTSGGEVSALGFYLNQLATGTALSYCQSSSSFGKAVFDGGDAGKRCAVLGLQMDPNKAGFGALGQHFADYATTDSPLSAAEFNSYVTNAATTGSTIAGRGQAVQLPATVSSVGILYRNPDVKTRLNLSSGQLCQVFDGEVTNWNQLDPSLPSRAITVFTRSDGSAASFALSNFLNRVCDPDAGETFAVDPSFAKALPSPLPAGASTAGFYSIPSNALLSFAVAATDGAIGYVETANSLDAVSGSVNLATVESLDPLADLPQAAQLLSNIPLVTDKAVGSYVQNGRPTLDTLAPTKPSCVLLVDPRRSAFPVSGYPIVNMSYLLFASSGNATKTANLQKLGTFLTQAGSFPAAGVTTPRVNTIDAAVSNAGQGKTGYAAFDPTSANAAAIQAAAQNCIGN